MINFNQEQDSDDQEQENSLLNIDQYLIKDSPNLIQNKVNLDIDLPDSLEEAIKKTSKPLINIQQEKKNEEEIQRVNPKEKVQPKPDIEKKQQKDQFKRGPYKVYNEELKKKAIEDYYLFKDIKKAAKYNNVQVKNLKRWISVGYKRKEGGGRKKEDPVMEDKVYTWLVDQYKKNILVTRKQIRDQALLYSNYSNKFKASKGWLEKFFARYKCKYMANKSEKKSFIVMDKSNNNYQQNYQKNKNL